MLLANSGGRVKVDAGVPRFLLHPGSENGRMLHYVFREDMSDSLLRMVAYLELLEKWKREGFVTVEVNVPHHQEG